MMVSYTTKSSLSSCLWHLFTPKRVAKQKQPVLAIVLVIILNDMKPCSRFSRTTLTIR